MNTRKLKYLLILILIYILSINFALANDIKNGKIESGFYINGIAKNHYFDIYTYLNNPQEAALAITNAGLNNTTFVHQGGKGFTLGELINSPFDYSTEDLLRSLTIYDFEESYTDFSSGEETQINLDILINTLKTNPSYYLLEEIPNEYMDVLEREYPEFLINIKDAWKNIEDNDEVQNTKIEYFLEHVKTEIEKNNNITEKNFNRVMYSALERVVFRSKHKDFRNALFAAYGAQIDYSDEHRELHPDLIPLSEAIKGSVLNNFFTLLYDIDNGHLVEGDNLDRILKTELDANYINYDVIENKNLNIGFNGIFNKLIESKANIQINVNSIDGVKINPPKTVNLMIEPYIDGPTMDITSTTSDYDELTRKVKVLDENGQVIEDTVEEVYIYNISTGTVSKQQIPSGQKISYLYISIHNPQEDYMIYFKTINEKWYKLRLTNYIPNEILVNEYLELE